MFKNRSVVIGVTGGIAAYKIGYLTSMFKKSEAEVHVIMTKNACEFVAPKTFEVLSGNPVVTDTFERTSEFNVEHVALAKKADLFIVAPATANFIAKAANGIADDMLTTTFVAAKCPKIVVPAMNTQMYEDSTVFKNIETLKNNGVFVMETNTGTLACGDEGAGRMKEPDEIFGFAKEAYKNEYDLSGIHFLITAGPTREYLDPVRFISSPSSGKMGYAIADAAAKRGAAVTLISGPVCIEAPQKVLLIKVVSAEEMYEECISRFDSSDIIIKTAAVSDYTPKETSKQKQKKGKDGITVELKRTKDILFELGQQKKNQILVGFAAETQNVEEYAKAKLKEKNADLIFANDVSEKNAGFGFDTNHLIAYSHTQKPLDLGIATKAECAEKVIELALKLYEKKRNDS